VGVEGVGTLVFPPPAGLEGIFFSCFVSPVLTVTRGAFFEEVLEEPSIVTVVLGGM
jgi:hypothetical protein